MTRMVRDRCIDPVTQPDEWREWLTVCRIPEGYWGCTAEAIKAPTVKQFVTDAVSNIKGWLGDGIGFYLHGPFNSGKSGLGAVVAMEAARRAEKVLWLSVRDLAAARFRENDEMAAVNDALYKCDLLVLDDLGSERFRLQSAAGAALEETIRIPYDRGRSVIVTSNIGWKDFPAHYAEIAGFISVLKRRIYPVAVVNDQWPSGPDLNW